MFFVIRIADRFQEIGIAPDSTAVFWWASSFSLQAGWIIGIGINCRAPLEQDLMFPSITEIVIVFEAEPIAGIGQDLTDVSLRGIITIEVIEPVIQQFRITIVFTLDVEQMQMAVGPSPRRLDMLVKFVESAILNLDSSPNRGVASRSVILNW